MGGRVPTTLRGGIRDNSECNCRIPLTAPTCPAQEQGERQNGLFIIRKRRGINDLIASKRLYDSPRAQLTVVIRPCVTLPDIRVHVSAVSSHLPPYPPSQGSVVRARVQHRADMWAHVISNPFTPKFKSYILTTFSEKCIGEVVRIGIVII